MSECFSEQFSEFKDEVIEMMKKRPADNTGPTSSDNAQASAITNLEIEQLKKEVKDIKEQQSKQLKEGVQSLEDKIKNTEIEIATLKK